MIYVADFYDLCLRQARDFVANLSRTMSQSWCNGIWALASSEWSTTAKQFVVHFIAFAARAAVTESQSVIRCSVKITP